MPSTTARTRRALRLAGASLFLFGLCAACTVSEGERATTGECPEGEVCSESAPRGLTFYGAWPGDSGGPNDFLRNIAMGGTQTLTFASADGTVLGDDGDDVDVDSSEPLLVRATYVDETSLGSTGVELSGLAEGSSYVRVLAGGTDELLDRVLMNVERVATVDYTLPSSPDGGEVAPGTTASVVFHLLGNSGDRLVDEGMTITSEDVEIDRVSWDWVEFDVPTDRDDVAFLLEAGHRRWEVRVLIER